MTHLKAISYHILSWKWIFLFVAMFLIGWGQRGKVINSSYFVAGTPNQWDLIIEIVCDPILLLYLFLPIILFFSFAYIQKNWNPVYLIRTGSLRRWILVSSREFSFLLISLLFLLILISFLLTPGFSYEWNWSMFSQSALSSFNEMSSLSRQTGLQPYIVILLQCLLLYGLFMFLHVGMSIIYLFIKNIYFIGLLSFSFSFYAIISFRYFLGSEQWGVYTYMTLYNLYKMYPIMYPVFLTLPVCAILIVMMAPMWKRKQLK